MDLILRHVAVTTISVKGAKPRSAAPVKNITEMPHIRRKSCQSRSGIGTELAENRRTNRLDCNTKESVAIAIDCTKATTSSASERFLTIV